MSPAPVAEYHTVMPVKAILGARLHEFDELAHEQDALPTPKIGVKSRRRR